jgi:hypothetical protein
MTTRKTGFVSPEERLEIARQRSYTERFDMLMRLIRISRMVAVAKIVEEKK